MKQSVSRKGNPYDNALIESFYKTIKRELLEDYKFDNPEEAKQGIFKYRNVLQYKKNAFFRGLFNYIRTI